MATTILLPYNEAVARNPKRLLLGGLVFTTVVFIVLVVLSVLMGWKSPMVQQQRVKLDFEQRMAVLSAQIDNPVLRAKQCPNAKGPSRASCLSAWLEENLSHEVIDASWKIAIVRSAAKSVAGDLREAGKDPGAALESEKGIELMELVAQILDIPELPNTTSDQIEMKNLARSGMQAIERTIAKIPPSDARLADWQRRIDELRARFVRHAL